MKRIVSYLLAAVLVLAPCMSVYATGLDDAVESGGSAADQADTGDQQNTGNGPDESGRENTGDSPSATSGADITEPGSVEEEAGIGLASEEEAKEADLNKGQVDVYIAQTLEWGEPVTFTVKLEGQDSKTITLPSEGVREVQEGVTFDNLTEGLYALEVSAPGFATYEQQLKVEGWTYKVSLATGIIGGYDYTAGGKHPGAVLIGDVNGNGVITEKDETELIDLIDQEKEPKDNPLADLNRDGKLDLTDLDYFVQGYKVSEDTASFVEQHVPSSAITQSAGDKTLVKGSLENLSRGEGAVTLTREDQAKISDKTPVTMVFDIDGDSFPTGGIVIDSKEDNPIDTAAVEITYTETVTGEDGSETKNDHTIEVPVVPEGIEPLLTAEEVTVTQDGFGKIMIDLGSQIAVKKVTIKITGMKNNNNLAEIAKVEFVNDMENRIPEPQRDIPEGLASEVGNKKFTVTWNACVNVTGYEVLIEDENGEQEVIATKGNMLNVSSFKQDKLVNGKEYKVRVQSVNGAWRSGYCSPIGVVPKVDKVPDAPDGLKAEGKYRAIDASWKMMEDTDSYNLYYRESGTKEYTKIEGITASKHTITDLKDKTSYELYVTGVNDLGEGKASLTSKAVTTDQDPAAMPKYKLINRADPGKVSGHIISAVTGTGEMKDSPLDTEAGTVWGTVDNNALSHHVFNTWDGGGFNALSLKHGFTYEFDQAYELDRIALQEVVPQSPNYGYVQVRYWDENGNVNVLPRMGIQKKADSDNRPYYLIKLSEPIKAKKLQFGLARAVASGTITVSEVYFYHYDSIERDIMALYEDDLHTVLRSDVDQSVIDALRKRINTQDPESKEYHPDKDYLERELKTAEDILNSKQLTETVGIYNTITTRDVGRGFGGLNAWQPLGVTAAAGEEITVYVGHNTKKTGDTTNLQLVSTQYHSESGSMFRAVATLKIGRNDITIPKLWSVDAESGGALYVQYTGNNANDRYAVRVNGGVEVPRLDLYKVSDAGERLARAEAYITKLDAYVGGIQAKHNEVHKNSKNTSVQYEYKAADCILGASDIMLDTMMLSLPAQQILAGTGSGSVQARAQKLVTSMDAMEGMMGLFYQHKGLNNNATEAKDKIPANHLNIRYQRMFAGAFMYASGNHIGIEWGSAPGMINGVPVQSDDSGRYQSGQYFGWGIAHEIGHCINQGTYAVAEITNNYFAVLAQAHDDNDTVRFKYDNVYDKVTSGTKGRASNVFTQLGMYWQLHLAYDSGFNYKTYSDYTDQLNNLFFARVDSYSRTPAKAPAPGGVALALSGDRDQDLMRLACAAAQKNILDFFVRWGMTPNQDTVNYADQFAAETRAIYYVDDNSRVYRVNGSGSSLGTAGAVEAVGDSTAAVINASAANQVDITLSSKNISAEDIQGYEIVRCTTSNGQVEREVVGFTTGSQFTDVVTTMNNRVVTYEITLIDKYLNRSAVKTLPPLKIMHEGEIDKTHWTASTNDMTATSALASDDEDIEDSCSPVKEAPIKNAIDNKSDTVYTGKAGVNAEVLIEFNQPTRVAGLKYTVNSGNPIKDYSVYVKNDADGTWIEAAAGSFEASGSRSVHFAKEGTKNIALYQTTAMKLAIKNQKGREIAITELDVFGVTGDNVEFRKASGSGTAAIGKLDNAYQYGQKDTDVIPAGSIVFTGTYKGNSAYNVVLLYDQNGNIVGGTGTDGSLNAEQVVFSTVSESGPIEDTYDGTWIYWIKPEQADLTSLKQVRTELYRVDNALTLEGQRMVSDTVFETMPSTLPSITLSGKKQQR
jgi:hypothetical protein